jgi:epoxyqueuosine reductase
VSSLWHELRAGGIEAGLDAIGVARAEPFLDARRHLVERKAAGLHGGMHFTYGNPERATDPSSALAGARSLVVGARSYRAAVPPPPNGPAARVARYSWRDHYEPLRQALGTVAERLRAHGYEAVVLVDDNRLVDREAAVRAGLGWYGKNANVLLPGQGSWFVLGSVVTTAPLDVDDAPVADGCGTCRRCIDGCPTGAIVAPGVVDARRCLAWLLQAKGDFPLEHRAALGDRIYGCDECQEVCPPNRRGGPLEHDGDGVDVVEMLRASDAALLERFGRWYIAGREPRYLRRNALVVLGNTASPDDAAASTTIERYRHDPDPMLRSHADWAAARVAARA